jgi:hypothetical protein
VGRRAAPAAEAGIRIERAAAARAGSNEAGAAARTEGRVVRALPATLSALHGRQGRQGYCSPVLPVRRGCLDLPERLAFGTLPTTGTDVRDAVDVLDAHGRGLMSRRPRFDQGRLHGRVRPRHRRREQREARVPRKSDAMLKEYKTRTNIGVGIAIVTQLAGAFLMETEDGNDYMAVAGMALLLLGFVFFVWGCMSYAAGKGHSKALGFLGLLSFIGLLILISLPDKHSASA